MIGDIDSMGYRVGYVDDDGLGWESRDERDTALTVGRYTDAWSDYKRGEGECPNPISYILDAPEHLHDRVADEIEWFHQLNLLLRAAGLGS